MRPYVVAHLRGDLGSPDHSDKRAGRTVHSALKIIKLLLHQKTCNAVVHELGHAHRGSMGAMSSSKCIIDEDFRVCRQLKDEESSNPENVSALFAVQANNIYGSRYVLIVSSAVAR